MILGNEAIKQALATGEIVCSPPPARIETHIDVHLGCDFWVPRSDEIIDMGSSDPKDHFLPVFGVTKEEPLYLWPNEFCLAHTDEYIGTTVADIEPHLETRSTVARWGLTVHVSAGIGDAGYCSRWTLELYNHGPSSLMLYPGMRIGLIKFFRVEGNTALYEGRYNTPDAEWTPDAMLPRRGNV